MSLPLAARSASSALVRARCAEPLASVIPACACVFTSSMPTSLDKVSTFWLTSPTSRLTYFLVAQPETATPAARNGTSTALIGSSMVEPVDARPRGTVSGLRHVTAPGPHHDALAGGADLDA